MTRRETDCLSLALSETGKHKALVFERSLGYNTTNSELLEAEIRKGLELYKAFPKGNDGHGDKFNVIILVDGANGNRQPIITGWIYDNGNDNPRMVTTYVYKELRRP